MPPGAAAETQFTFTALAAPFPFHQVFGSGSLEPHEESRTPSGNSYESDSFS
jgi:hypothetical protein